MTSDGRSGPGLPPRGQQSTSAGAADLVGAVRALDDLHRRLGDRLRPELDAHGLVSADLAILEAAAAAGDPGIRLSLLATQIGVSTGGLTRMIRRLSRKGFLERRRSRVDQRVAFAVVTEAGLSALNDILPRGLAVIDPAFVEELSAVCHTMWAVMHRDEVRPVAR